MRVAFYAPMKSPAHAVPSGDRRIARLLMRALRQGGHDVVVASHLRAWNGDGSAAAQERLMRRGQALARRYVERHRGSPPDLWFTYHLYHKAPDWIGPSVCRSLSVPYVAAEASFAPKQEHGPWALGHAAVRAALGQVQEGRQMTGYAVAAQARADTGLVDGVHVDDAVQLAEADCAHAARAERRAKLGRDLGIDQARPWLVATGMMRPGDKLCSYRALGAALQRIADRSWELLVIGDGPARAEVEAAVGRAGRTRFLGQLDASEVLAVQAACDLFVWPAVNEAYGLALLEAQAVGLAAVAGESPGVAAIVRDGTTGLLVRAGDDAAFADAVAGLLQDAARRRAMGRAARETVAAEHGLSRAAAVVGDVVEVAAARSRR